MAHHNSNSVNFLLLVTIFLSCCTLQSWSYRVSTGQEGLVQQNYQVSDDVSCIDRNPQSQSGMFGISRGPKSSKTKKRQPKTVIANDVESLRQAVLDKQTNLKNVRIQNYVKEQTEAISDHEVLRLIKERFETYSTPGNRRDNATLAIAMEGGGMRGCVSAGMAAAIASLGLSDVFDTVYGSSAGSAVGAYLISRQICLDIYLDILPAAKTQFVCKKRLLRSMVSNLAQVMVSGLKRGSKTADQASILESSGGITPGLNTSYLLDGILGHNHGLRPLDMERFQENEKKQRLRIVSSAVDADGNMFSKVFGSDDFFNSTMMQTKHNGDRQGLFACLQASMTVPGATGPPVRLHRAKNKDKVLPCFDAFCFEPVPYRSAVEEGATHVLAMCTRPEGCELKTKPGVYEQGVAPLYFKSHGLPKVAEYFEKGGQQYIYAEDILTLEEGKMSKSSKVSVPPPKIYHGVEQAADQRKEIAERSKGWKKAHLFPMKVASNIPELATLEQDKDAVLEAVRSGYAAAFDILAPVVGLDLDLSGSEASKFVFPRKSEDEQASPISEKDMELEDERVLNTQLHVPGAAIPSFVRVSTDAQDLESTNGGRRRKRERIRSIVLRIVKWKRNNNKQPMPAVASSGLELGQLDASSLSTASPTSEMAETLLKSLPGLNGERALFHHLSKDLRSSVYGGETME
mmetsp:Transcript_25808/g.63203  ORF Transcript_25808/g.63203 Transcript_25808/m.63203 type:complete len:687 (-) Transcript_25808:1745-3805(-)